MQERQGARGEVGRSGQIPDNFLKHKIKCSLFSSLEWDSVNLMVAPMWHGSQLEQDCIHLSSIGRYGWLQGGSCMSLFSMNHPGYSKDSSGQRRWPRHMYLINRITDTCSRRWLILHGFQDLALLLDPGSAPVDHALRIRSFNMKSVSWNIFGTWGQKELAELAPATSSAGRDGAMLQTLVPSTLGTSNWSWCPHWQVSVILAGHSVGIG